MLRHDTARARPLWRQRPVQLLICSIAFLLAAAGGLAWRVPAAADPSPAPAPVELSAEAVVARYQEAARSNPQDTEALVQLGLAYLQRVRETADAAYYAKAEQVLAAASANDPGHLDVLLGQGILALSRHDFAGGLAWGQKAFAADPYSAAALGEIVDGQVELGRYAEAVATLQKMVDLRPGLPSYTRVSYLRELHGQVDGAIAAMSYAVDASPRGTEGNLWSLVQLGNLYFNRGDQDQADATYRRALRDRPDYVYALAGVARVQAAQGRFADAIQGYRDVVARLPLPEYVIALGDLYTVAGQPGEARSQYELVAALEQLNTAAGVDVDLELGMFDADHGGDLAQALARARSLYARRPTIYTADLLAWTLYRTGDHQAARRYSLEALRLGTRDASLHYHAGMIAKALGREDEARNELSEALKINPHFGLIQARAAGAALEELSHPSS